MLYCTWNRVRRNVACGQIDIGLKEKIVTKLAKDSLFDCVERTYMGYSRYDESQFRFLNRSAREGANNIRKTLEQWFARLPEQNRKWLRRRFRKGDRDHGGAFLELATHEILCEIGAFVEVDPDLDGKTPDFAATYGGERILVECTVSQNSDKEIKALERRNCILQAIDSIETGNLFLDVTLEPSGNLDTTLDIEPLVNGLEMWLEGVKRELRNRLQSTNPNEPMVSLEQEVFPWYREGWRIRFGLSYGRPDFLIGSGSRAIGIRTWVGVIGGGCQLRKSLKKKANKYNSTGVPYLIVAGAGMYFPESTTLENALSDGFMDRYRHVSAILYKSFDPHESVWGLCHPAMPWKLVHNPWATHPLPRGMFPFAKEWVPEAGEFNEIEPTCTLNDVIGLPDPWPQRSENYSN